jgi:hypothetical protein
MAGIDELIRTILAEGDAELQKLAEDLNAELLAQKRNEEKILKAYEKQGQAFARGFINELRRRGFGKLAEGIVSPAVTPESNVDKQPEPAAYTVNEPTGESPEDVGEAIETMMAAPEATTAVAGESVSAVEGQMETTPGGETAPIDEAALDALNALIQGAVSQSPAAAAAFAATSPSEEQQAQSEASEIEAALSDLASQLEVTSQATTPEEVIDQAIGEAGEESTPSLQTTPPAAGGLIMDPMTGLLIDPVTGEAYDPLTGMPVEASFYDPWLYPFYEY